MIDKNKLGQTNYTESTNKQGNICEYISWIFWFWKQPEKQWRDVQNLIGEPSLPSSPQPCLPWEGWVAAGDTCAVTGDLTGKAHIDSSPTPSQSLSCSCPAASTSTSPSPAGCPESTSRSQGCLCWPWDRIRLQPHQCMSAFPFPGAFPRHSGWVCNTLGSQYLVLWLFDIPLVIYMYKYVDVLIHLNRNINVIVYLVHTYVFLYTDIYRDYWIWRYRHRS